jgi:hypothetical protein
MFLDVGGHISPDNKSKSGEILAQRGWEFFLYCIPSWHEEFVENISSWQEEFVDMPNCH